MSPWCLLKHQVPYCPERLPRLQKHQGFLSFRRHLAVSHRVSKFLVRFLVATMGLWDVGNIQTGFTIGFSQKIRGSTWFKCQFFLKPIQWNNIIAVSYHRPCHCSGKDLTFDPTAASHSTLLQKNRTHPHIRPYPNKNTQPFQEKTTFPGSHLTLPHFTLPQTKHPGTNPPCTITFIGIKSTNPPWTITLIAIKSTSPPWTMTFIGMKSTSPPGTIIFIGIKSTSPLNHYIHCYQINQPPWHN